MKTFKGTKGKWEVSKSGNPTFNKCVIAEDGGSVCFITNWSDDEHTAKLIADAGTTTNKCGLFPSELLEQRNELLEALKEVRSDLFYQISSKFGSEKASKYPSIIQVEKAINKAL